MPERIVPAALQHGTFIVDGPDYRIRLDPVGAAQRGNFCSPTTILEIISRTGGTLH